MDPEGEDLRVRHIIEEVWREKGDTLNLSYRKMKVIPAEVANFTFITSLLLNNNKVLMPPEEVCQLTGLEALSLEHNELTVLPSGIAALSHTLQFLNLSHNPLSYLSPAVAQLENLSSLWLGYTQLTSFPNQICSMCKLRYLSLEGNQISSFTRERPFASLKELKWLSLAKNHLNSVGEALSSLPNLHTVYLNQNLLTEIPTITSCPSLTNLNLSDNKLSTLPEDMPLLGKHKLKLDVRNNPLTMDAQRPAWTTTEEIAIHF